MKFIIDPPKQVTVKITALVPGAKGYEKQPFTAVIKKLYGDERKEFIENIADNTDAEIIKKLVAGLPDMYGEAGEKIEFNAALLDQIIRIDYVATPLARECVMVQDENMRKVLTEKN